MLQAVMTSPGEIDFRDVPVPQPVQGQVLVQMMRLGICGSDIHVYHGRHPFTTYPVVQGHEVAGRIEKIGPGVTGFNIGDRVTIQPQVVCGRCVPCRAGQFHICDELKVMGFQTTGMASDYFVVDARRVLKLPDDISYDHGAMVEPLAVAIHALKRGGGSDGRKILVLGAGPIGHLTAQAAKGLGASRVMITDVSDHRLSLAQKCGVDFALNVRSQNLEAELLKAFGPGKADLILDCAGSAATIDQAVQCARKGTDIIVVAVIEGKVGVELGILQDRELRLIGTLMYWKEDFEEAIDLIQSGSVHLDPLISRHFDLLDYPKAYRYIEENQETSLKVMIKGRTA